MPGILQVGDQQVVGTSRFAQPVERRCRIGRGVDVVLRQRQRLRQQVADARLVVDDEHAVTARRGLRRRIAPAHARRSAIAGCRATRRCRASGTATAGRRGQRESFRP